MNGTQQLRCGCLLHSAEDSDNVHGCPIYQIDRLKAEIGEMRLAMRQAYGNLGVALGEPEEAETPSE